MASLTKTSSVLRQILATSKSKVHVLIEASQPHRFGTRVPLELSQSQWKMICDIFNNELAKTCPTSKKRAVFWTDNSYQLPILSEPANSESLMKIYQACFFRLGPDATREGIEASKRAPDG